MPNSENCQHGFYRSQGCDECRKEVEKLTDQLFRKVPAGTSITGELLKGIHEKAKREIGGPQDG